MAISLANIRNELLPGLFEVRGKYDMIPKQWNQVFETRKSNMAIERSTQMRFLGLPRLKAEGAATTFDNQSGERFIYNIEPVEIALGYAITRKAIADNLYKKEFNPTNLQLNEAFAQFKEVQAASVLNTGTTAITGLNGDGQPLFSLVHPVDGATYANMPTIAVSLNEQTLLQAMVNIRTTFVNEAGLKILARGHQLIIPPQLEPVALRLLKTELRPGTADNDINAILSTAGGLKEGYLVMDFLTSAFAWFIKTNIKGFIHMEREPFETDMQVDFITDNLLVKGYERYGFAYNDPRCAYGSYPTS
jgi:hypothetical protein